MPGREPDLFGGSTERLLFVEREIPAALPVVEPDDNQHDAGDTEPAVDEHGVITGGLPQHDAADADQRVEHRRDLATAVVGEEVGRRDLGRVKVGREFVPDLAEIDIVGIGDTVVVSSLVSAMSPCSAMPRG